MSVRIATLYGDIASCGRNDGGPIYHSTALKLIFGKENIVHLFPKGDLSRFGHFDYSWLTDWGEDALGYQDFKLPPKSIYITSDTHLGYDYRLLRAKDCADGDGWVFCNQEVAVQNFVRDGIPPDRVFWLPHAFDPIAYSIGVWNDNKTNIYGTPGDWDREAVPQKKFDITFCGNLNDENRVLHLDRLFKEIPNFHWGNQRFHLAAEKYNQSKIVFNVSARKELNMRMFEALGSGSFLLTDNIPEDQNVFREGVHFVGYRNMDEMIDKAKYYLKNEDERNKIAEAGYFAAISHHTYLHRVLTVLDIVGIPYDKERATSLLPRIEVVA